MQSDDPAFLLVGTEVSAKFKGAFCEAKIKRFSKSVKCKVLLKKVPPSTIFVDHSQIQGILEVNQLVDVVDGKETFQGVIQHVKDNSTYTVVFNDGDERQLRRTQLCIKGAKHFDDSANLDTMPLYNPESFSSPVVPEIAKGNRVKIKGSEEEGQGVMKVDGAKGNGKKRQRLSEEEEMPTKKSKNDEKARKIVYEPGNAVAVYDDTSKKGLWVPAVVVSSKAFTNFAKGGVTLGKNDIPLRGFRDAKYFSALAGCLVPLRSAALKNLDSAFRSAFERASGFAEKGTFPMNWERNQIYGDEMLGIKGRRESSASVNESKKEQLEEKKKEKPKAVKNSGDSSSSECTDEDEEYGEERDQFTAQLYKFHEERGTPINRAPILGGKDIDMFRLYNLVQAYGGKKRVTENNKWKKIMCKLHLEGCPGANPRKVQNAYSRYLDHFNTVYKNLGVSNWMASSTSSRSVRQIRLTDRDADQLRKRRLAQIAEKKKEKEKQKKEQKRDIKEDENVAKDKDKETVKKSKVKVGREEKKEKMSGSLKKEKIKEKSKKEGKEVKKENESDFSHLSDVRLEAAVESKGVDARELLTKEHEKDIQTVVKSGSEQAVSLEEEKMASGLPGAKNNTEGSTHEQEKSAERKRKAVKVHLSKNEIDDIGKGEETDGSKKRTKQVVLKKMHRKKIRSESDATEDYSERLKRLSPSVTSSAPSTSVATDQVASVSGSEDEGSQSVIRKVGKRKGSFRETSAVSTTSCSSDHTVDLAATRGTDMKLKKRRKERDGERTVRATAFTRFYQGQNVRAHHLAKWYDARVQNVDQPSIEEFADVLVEFEKRVRTEAAGVSEPTLNEKYSSTKQGSAYLWLYNRLEELQKRVRCFVHYLGWNNRYDSWALSADMKVTEKDQQESESQFRELVPEKICSETLESAFLWRSNAVGPEVALDGLNCNEMLAFKEIRSKPSATSCQQPSTSELSGRQESPDRSLLGSQKVIQKLPSEGSTEKGVTSANGPSTSSEKKTDSCASKVPVSQTREQPETSFIIPSHVSNSQSSAETRPAVAKETTVSSKEESPCKDTVEKARHQCPIASKSTKSALRGNSIANKIAADTAVRLEDINEATTSISLTDPSGEKLNKDVDLKTSKTDVFKSKIDPSKHKRLDESTTFKRKKLASESKCAVENIKCDISLFRGEVADSNSELVYEDSKHAVIQFPIKPLETVFLTTHGSKPKRATHPTEDIAVSACKVKHELEKESSPTSLDKSKILHSEPSENGSREELEAPISSSSTAQLKQPLSNLTSVTNDFEPLINEVADVNDDDCASPKDSFHALKLRMLQKMETDMALDEVEKELGLGPIDNNLAGDALIYSLQARIQELKDLYHLVRAEQAHLDRRWRKTYEKRKQREKEQRRKDELAHHVSDCV